MGAGGWKTPFPLRFGGRAHEPVEDAYTGIRENLGDAFSDDDESAIDGETKAQARLLASANSRLEAFVRQVDPRALTGDMLGRWERILGIRPSRRDSGAKRRRRVASRLLTTYRANSEGLDRLVREAFSPWDTNLRYIDVDDALVYWPGDSSNTTERPWSSTVARITAEYLKPAWASARDAESRAAACIKALDEHAPAWTVFDTSETQTTGDNAGLMGFYLDQPNIDVSVFWE